MFVSTVHFVSSTLWCLPDALFRERAEILYLPSSCHPWFLYLLPFSQLSLTRFCHPKLFYFFLQGSLWCKVILARLLCTFSLLLYPFSHALAIHNIHIDFTQRHSDIFLVLFSINFLIIHSISFHFLIIIQHWVDIFM